MQHAIECRGIDYDRLNEELNLFKRRDFLPLYPWEREEEDLAMSMMFMALYGQSTSQLARNLAPHSMMHPAQYFLCLPNGMKF